MNLEKLYKEEIKKALLAKFGYKSIMQVPKISKIVINAGVSKAVNDKKALTEAFKSVELITGQKPITRLAKNSIAGFKLREGMEIGVKVTLRNEKMYNFLYKLINISLPREKDFKGLGLKHFDENGNYTLGIKEVIIFPEIKYDEIQYLSGLSITIVTTAKTKEESEFMLREFGFPFIKSKGAK